MALLAYEKHLKLKIDNFFEENKVLPTKENLCELNIRTALVMKEYGSLVNLYKVLGYKDFEMEKTKCTIDLDKLENDVCDFYLANRTMPTLKQLNNLGYSYFKISKHYGSVKKFTEEIIETSTKLKDVMAEVKKKSDNETKERIASIKKDLITEIKENNVIPNLKEAKNKKIDVDFLIKEYGSYPNAKEELNLYEEEDKLFKEIVNEFRKNSLTSKELTYMKECSSNSQKKLLKRVIERHKFEDNGKLKQSFVKTLDKLKVGLVNEPFLRKTLVDYYKENVLENDKVPVSGPGKRKCLFTKKSVCNDIEGMNRVLSKYSSFNDMLNKVGVKDAIKQEVINKLIQLNLKLNKGYLTSNDVKESNLSLSIFRDSRVNKDGKKISINPSWSEIREIAGVKSRNEYLRDNFDEFVSEEIKALMKYAKNNNDFRYTALKDAGIKVYYLSKKYSGFKNAMIELGLVKDTRVTKAKVSELKEFFVTYNIANNKYPTAKIAESEGFTMYENIIKQFKNRNNFIASLEKNVDVKTDTETA